LAFSRFLGCLTGLCSYNVWFGTHANIVLLGLLGFGRFSDGVLTFAFLLQVLTGRPGGACSDCPPNGFFFFLSSVRPGFVVPEYANGQFVPITSSCPSEERNSPFLIQGTLDSWTGVLAVFPGSACDKSLERTGVPVTQVFHVLSSGRPTLFSHWTPCSLSPPDAFAVGRGLPPDPVETTGVCFNPTLWAPFSTACGYGTPFFFPFSSFQTMDRFQRVRNAFFVFFLRGESSIKIVGQPTLESW